jgi:predicted HAD superfamily phosphohydrolase YqeG
MKLFAELDPSKIKGYFIMLDIDGTLAHDRLSAVEEAIVKQVAALKKNNHIVLVSNRNDHNRNKKVAEMTKVDYLHTNIRKPSRRILKLIKNEGKRPLLMIGDKFLTDGLFAKRVGAKFIKVKRLESHRDSKSLKLINGFDDLVYKFFK